jgi:PAS domain S-box-containing protein
MNPLNPVILCVDDEEANLKLLEKLLVPRGYVVVSAANGKDALLKIKSQAIDLVLLDIIMPGMNGFEVCRQIKEDQNLRNIPVIMITASIVKKDRILGIEAGAEEFLSKPFDLTEVLARIKMLLKMKRLDDERKREESQKEDALVALQKSHDELERRVRERTAELAQANEILQADITERKRAEEALRESAAFLNATGQMAKVGGWELDAANLCLNWTEETYRIHELPRGHKPTLEEAINYYHPDERQKLSDSIQRALKYGETYDMELRFISAKGKHLWTRSICFPQTVDGKIVKLIGTFQDITDRKQAEEALRESEDRYRSLYVDSRDAIMVLSPDRGFITANPASIKLFACRDEQDFTTRSPVSLSPEYQPDGVRSMDKSREMIRLALEKGSHLFEWMHRRADGIDFPATVLLSRLESDSAPQLLQATVRDITELKRAGEALKENEKKYRLLADNVSDVIFVLDMNLHYTYVSPSVKILWGYEPLEVLKQQAFETLTSSSIDLAVRALSEVMELEKSEHRDINISRTLPMETIRKDGTIVWTEVKFSFIRDEKQQAVGILGVTRDITERRHAEHALRDNEARLNLALETNHTGVWELNLLDHSAFRTLIHDRIFGYETLLPKWTYEMFLEHVLPEDRLEVDRLFSKATAAQSDWSFECRIRRTDGEVRWIMATGQHIKTSKGKPVQMLGVVQDITERKQVEENLLESKTLFEAVVENIPLMIFLKAATDLRFVIFNRAGEELLGYDRKDLLDKNDLDLFPPEQAAHFMAKDREVLDGKAIVMDIPEEQIQTAKKGQRLLHTKKVCIRSTDGTTKYLLGISEDITERKLVADELQETLDSLRKAFSTTIQVMVSAVEMKDPYTAGHQLRSADLAQAIAAEMGLAQEKIDGIRMAGSIHDIGKLAIPSEILSKPTKLTKIEFSLIKEHAEIGYEMLKDVESPWPLAQIVYQHHERMNGSGYPRNLKGDEIIMEARIMAVADVMEAMASHRPYRPALGIDAALEEIKKNRGIFYDNAVADACLRLFREKGYKLLA